MFNNYKKELLIILYIFILNTAIGATILKLEDWHDSNLGQKNNVLVNTLGEMGLGITNIPEAVNIRASCGGCHVEEAKIPEKESIRKQRTILVPADKTLATNILVRKNGGKLEFITSEYAKDFSNGPYQASFVNDGITDSRRNSEFGNQPSFWGCDMLTKWKEPFPQEFDAEVKNFSLYINSDPITSKDIYNVTDDGGGWSYNNNKFSYLSPNNVLGDGLFPSYQNPVKFNVETWIQSKNLEYTINTNNPKWVRIDFKKPTTIASIFMTSDDSANVHNMETDIFKLQIIVVTPKGQKKVYDNSRNQMVEDEFAKGYAAYFDPIEATGVIFKFYTEKYIEWQRILIFRKPWKKVLSARATQKFKDYSPEVFYFTPTEVQYLKISIESNYGNPKWVDVGEMEVYNSYPKNLALYENGGRILDCSRVDDYVYGPNRLLDGKLLGDDEYSIQKKNYVAADEYQIVRGRKENENDVKIILDLGKETVFGQINHFNTGDSGAKSVVIEYSLDNKKWEELGTCERLDFAERDLPNKDTFVFSPTRAKYIKFNYKPTSWIKNKLKISEYEVFEVSPQYKKEGVFFTKLYDLKLASIFSKLVVNADEKGKIPLNTEIKVMLTTDKEELFSMDRHVSTYVVKPNEPSVFPISEIHNGDRFVQFKILLNSEDFSATPFLNNISIEYRSLNDVLAEAKSYEDNKKFPEAREIYDRIKSSKFSPEWILKAEQGLVRISDTINADALKLFEDGNKLFNNEQFDDAIEIYREVLRKYSETGMNEKAKEKINEASIGKEFNMAKSLADKRKYWKAIEQYKAIIDNYPSTVWAKKSQIELDNYFEMEANDIYDNANRLLKNKQFDEAKVLFEQIKEKYSASKWQKNAEEGIKECIKGKSELIFMEAQKLYDMKNFEEALGIYRRIIKEYPETEAYKKAREEIINTQDKIMENKFNIALKLKENKKYNEAVSAFEYIVKEGVIPKWVEKSKAEIKNCEKIVHDILVQEAKNLYDQGLALLKKEQEDKAYDIFEKIIKDYKNTGWDNESQKILDTIRSKRIYEEIEKEIKERNYYEVLVKLDELKKIELAKELVDKTTSTLNKDVEKIYEAGKRYARDKEYKKAYLVYYYIKVNFTNTEWTDRIADRLKLVEEKLKE
ncbi:tetratricopeptide repeat protein [Candidatus Desantisbacteria bacterium]|nr:tetratricopeptide repeat protein [Candidatus Desantisbacteria bacterium]